MSEEQHRRSTRPPIREHQLDEISVNLTHFRDVLRCVAHSILFARAPGPVRPLEVTCDHFQITYARCGVREVDQQVDGAIEGLKKVVEEMRGSSNRTVQLVLSFFEREEKKALFGLMSHEEKAHWEKWIIPVSIDHHGLNNHVSSRNAGRLYLCRMRSNSFSSV